MCRKVSYRGRGSARKAARGIFAVKRRRVWPYRCDDCGYWHVTTKRSFLDPGYTPPPPSDGPRRRGRRLRPGESLEEVARQMREDRC